MDFTSSGELAMIRNQMLIDERLGPLMEKYDKDF